MTNKELAAKFNLLGKLMELHGENSFKIRSYTNAYLSIKKWPDPIATLDATQLPEIKGIGKAIQEKIIALVTTGEMPTLTKYAEKTPPGIIEMLKIKGFGPKKIKVLWEELEIETIGELQYAINENRLIELKGFGAKTQQTLKEQLAYYVESADKIHYATATLLGQEIIEQLNLHCDDGRFHLTGAVYRKSNVLDTIDLLTILKPKKLEELLTKVMDFSKGEKGWNYKNISLEFHHTTVDHFYYSLVKTSSGQDFWSALNISEGNYATEQAVFEEAKLPFYIPEYREDENVNTIDNYIGVQNIITQEEILGCIHNHSTYSDGMQTIPQMLEAAKVKGYEYFVITDHSKSAFYANGLSEERLSKQLDEIRILDQGDDDIKLFSGIESDILNNGDLDYRDEVLADLDVIVASIHSNLKMDKAKATARLIKAVENPYTSILGHPTGRLLLSREAYPIDHKAVIDACADNGVALELNANPHRLDIDWRWLDYAVNKGVLISINPDAHSTKGIEDITYGVASARKAGLPISYCLNAMAVEEFEEWLEEQHSKR